MWVVSLPLSRIFSPAVVATDAEDHVAQLVDTRPDQPEEPQHLSLVGNKVHIPEPPPCAEIFDLEDGTFLEAFMGRLGRVKLCKRTPQHDFGKIDVLFPGLPRGHRYNSTAVAKHGEPVCDLEHLFEMVSYIDDRNTLSAEAPHQVEEQALLRLCQDRRRFVEQKHLGVVADQSAKD